MTSSLPPDHAAGVRSELKAIYLLLLCDGAFVQVLIDQKGDDSGDVMLLQLDSE